MLNAGPLQQPSVRSLPGTIGSRVESCNSQNRDDPARRGVGRLPQANSAFWLLAALTLLGAGLVLRPPAALPMLRAVSVPQCPVPIEVPGQGVHCLSAEEAHGRGLVAGDVCPIGPHGEPLAGPPARMAPRRLLAAGVLLDPRTATAAELEALPEVGPGLARRIVEARTAREQRGEPSGFCQADLRRIPGLGERRLKRLLPFLVPLP